MTNNAQEVFDAIEIFDKFVNTGVSAGLEDVNPIEVVKAYNTIRNYINNTIEFDTDED